MKTTLITGANSGIGLSAARALFTQGHHLVLLCRTIQKAQQTKALLLGSGEGKITCWAADFSSLAEVQRVSNEILAHHSNLDVLINNAGCFNGQALLSKDGFELTLAVNHLAPMLLTLKLLPLLSGTEANPCRIVNVASGAHRRGRFDFNDPMLSRGYSSGKAYCQSKLANILFSTALASRLAPTCTVNALHPGVVATHFAAGEGGSYGFLFRFFKRWMKTPDAGAETVIFLANSPAVAGQTGGYYRNLKLTKAARHARSEQTAERLWRWSVELLIPFLTEQEYSEATRGKG